MSMFGCLLLNHVVTSVWIWLKFGTRRSGPINIELKTKKIVITPQMCRVCLSDGVIPIFSQKNPLDFYLSQCLEIICQVQVTLTDNYPQNLCQNCFDVLDSVMKLRETAKNTERLLKTGIHQTVNQNQIEFETNVEYIKRVPEVITLVPSLKQTEVKKKRENWKDKPEKLSEANDIESDENTSTLSDLQTDSDKELITNAENIKNAKKQSKRKSSINGNTSIDVHIIPPLTVELIQESKKNKSLRTIYYKADIIDGTKQFQCRICKKYICLKTSDHLLTHLPDTVRTHICEVCGKSFKAFSTFAIHKTTHTNVVPFECKLCPYKGRTKNGLNVHTKRIHLKDYKYECTICPKKFLGSSNLQSHLRRHGEPKFKCEVCKKLFYEKHLLKTHTYKVHASIEPHECVVCGNKYRTRRNLLRHELLVHKRKKIHNPRAIYLKIENMKGGI